VSQWREPADAVTVGRDVDRFFDDLWAFESRRRAWEPLAT
jgi:hypothetical protein